MLSEHVITANLQLFKYTYNEHTQILVHCKLKIFKTTCLWGEEIPYAQLVETILFLLNPWPNITNWISSWIRFHYNNHNFFYNSVNILKITRALYVIKYSNLPNAQIIRANGGDAAKIQRIIIKSCFIILFFVSSARFIAHDRSSACAHLINGNAKNLDQR